jgi:hypothetical protein
MNDQPSGVTRRCWNRWPVHRLRQQGNRVKKIERLWSQAKVTARAASITYKIVRLVMSIMTPEVTVFDLAMLLAGWLLRCGPPEID